MNEQYPRRKTCEIEEQLARDRAALAASIAELRERFAPDQLAGGAFGMLSAGADPVARAVRRVVSRNPIAAAVAGAGLAWLAMGRRTRVETDARNMLRAEALSRWEDEGGPALTENADETHWVDEAETLRELATAKLHALEEKVRAGLATAGEHAMDRAAIFADLARDVRASLRRGLDDLSTTAQDKIVAAREAAYTAQLSMRRKTRQTLQDHPMAAVAGGIALGAAIGAVAFRRKTLPTAAESDLLLHETCRLLAEERQRARVAMQALSGAEETPLRPRRR